MSNYQSARQSKSSAPITISAQGSSKEIEPQVDDTDPQGPFEGPEKLLELWFADSQDEVAGYGLRAVDSHVWEEMLDIVKCKVLSTIKGQDVDAYLLRCVKMFRHSLCA
jgi:S-adenosylmethionine decarboxylase